jgi:hypothetical protein
MVSGSVVRLSCMACGRVTSDFRFEGEGDTDTMGLGSLASCAANEIVLAEIQPDEWNSFEQGGSAQFEARVCGELRRKDLRVVRLLRSVDVSAPGVGVDFRDFRKAYRPPELFFSCPCCSQGESKLMEELTVEQFVKSGGRVITTGRLSLAGHDR